MDLLANPQTQLQLKRLIEALIFAADSPLSVERIKEALDGEEEAEYLDTLTLRSLCRELRLEYDQLDRAFELLEVAGGFQFRTRPQYAAAITRLRKTSPLRLSRAALETLAIVAYRQPVLRAEIERIRGVDCGGVLKALMERRLVKIRGRENLPGRPLTYGTTKRFLEIFELNSLKDLPSLEELALEAGLDPALSDTAHDVVPGLFPLQSSALEVAEAAARAETALPLEVEIRMDPEPKDPTLEEDGTDTKNTG